MGCHAKLGLSAAKCTSQIRWASQVPRGSIEGIKTNQVSFSFSDAVTRPRRLPNGQLKGQLSLAALERPLPNFRDLSEKRFLGFQPLLPPHKTRQSCFKYRFIDLMCFTSWFTWYLSCWIYSSRSMATMFPRLSRIGPFLQSKVPY